MKIMEIYLSYMHSQKIGLSVMTLKSGEQKLHCQKQ